MTKFVFFFVLMYIVCSSFDYAYPGEIKYFLHDEKNGTITELEGVVYIPSSHEFLVEYYDPDEKIYVKEYRSEETNKIKDSRGNLANFSFDENSVFSDGTYERNMLKSTIIEDCKQILKGKDIIWALVSFNKNIKNAEIKKKVNMFLDDRIRRDKVFETWDYTCEEYDLLLDEVITLVIN